MLKSMLTTIDNPYSPFDEYDEWNAWDIRSGYNTASFLARIVTYTDQLSDFDIELANERAIDEICFENVNGVFKKIQKEFPDS
jgi:hypothetical protein